MSELITVQATRYRCPHCRKSYAHRATATNHMSRCFKTPSVRSCKTCKHYDTSERACELDVDLETARCSTCGGFMYPDGSGDCVCSPIEGGKPVYGLRVQCDEWEADRG